MPYYLAITRIWKSQVFFDEWTTGGRLTDNVHGVIVEYPEVSVLTDDGEEVAARGERELIDGALAHTPPVEGISRRLGFARVN